METVWVVTDTAPVVPDPGGMVYMSKVTTEAGPVVGGNRASLMTVVLEVVTWPATAAVPPPVIVPSSDRLKVTSDVSLA